MYIELFGIGVFNFVSDFLLIEELIFFGKKVFLVDWGSFSVIKCFFLVGFLLRFVNYLELEIWLFGLGVFELYSLKWY